MTDVTNPGLVAVEDETYGTPDPNGGSAQWQPLQDDVLEDVAADGYPRPDNDVGATTFPTPDEVVVSDPTPLYPTDYTVEPDLPEVDVASQDLGHGTWVPVDPLDPAAGKRFVSPSEFVVVGPAQSFQTNLTETVTVTVTVTAVYDADNLYNPPSPDTTRYMLVTAPPSLTSYPVSLLGRQVTFSEDTTTVANQGAVRNITNYGGNFIVVDKEAPFVSNGDVAELADPAVGDTFEVDVRRVGSEQVNTEGGVTEVFILPPPPTFVADPPQDAQDLGDVFVTDGPAPYIGSGTRVPSAVTVEVADQVPLSTGLPADVFV